MKRTALVTGANKGIGYEIARQLSACDMEVYLGTRNIAAGKEAAVRIGNGVKAIPLDVTDRANVDAAAEAIQDASGKLDVLVNNAAILVDREGLLGMSEDVLRQTLETNLLGPLRLALAFAPLLARSDSARLINVSSGGGQLSGDLQTWAPAYCISKTALNGLTLQLAAALPAIAVNSVCPGWVRTDMGGKEAPRSVEQGADTVVWLATNAPHSLTGKFLRDREVIDW